ncbi:MAG: aminotransferase class IV [Mycobacterium sp.]|nr:aminotransferase class IV [Mycobacterium sp.]
MSSAGSEWRLLESMLWTPEDGFYLFERHMRRLVHSGASFGWTVDIEGLESALRQRCLGLRAPMKIRLLVSACGEYEIDLRPMSDVTLLNAAIAKGPVNENDEFLRHKTTRRDVYESRLREVPGVDDVVLWNRRGELTETCFGNLVFRFGTEWVTPPLRCGLLPGTMREQLLDDGVLREGVVQLSDIDQSEGVYRINSVRKWNRLRLNPVDLPARSTRGGSE